MISYIFYTPSGLVLLYQVYFVVVAFHRGMPEFFQIVGFAVIPFFFLFVLGSLLDSAFGNRKLLIPGVILLLEGAVILSENIF